MELADRLTVGFLIKTGTSEQYSYLRKSIHKKIEAGGKKIEAGGNENLTINLLWPYKSMGVHNPLGLGQFGPQGLDWQDLCREPLNIATYKIYKLWASWFQRRRFFKFFPLQVYGSYISAWRPS